MKPRVILNAAMTLDGKIATKRGSSEISGKEDLLRVHRLRRDSDAILVGINTVLADDPRLTIHKISADSSDNPVRVVVDSQARTPLSSRILSKDAPTIIAVSKKAPQDRLDKLGQYAKIIICGDERVDLECLMENLGSQGIVNLMLEGGSTLNYSMLSLGLVDEVRVCVAPMIVGGSEAKTLVDGDGMDYMSQAVKLKLIKSYPLAEDLILEYEVIT
ncbi:2,5-diamino-6-(ribosylamino)-4(3H)-pyrimidinone 5'-phosphate reductase [Methanobacterium sp. CWC-01]|uniref:2,5-diamino-6-(ribosylamino)-4(3H)-pyrimidinone 5'-phosphate reductase n=1 Tax=Methanobacterium aridiramus TaxID=2584467 RepID=UPI002577BC29|nr:2,5-diamino-6-(ribosylamino)-4(3H)-pyrimidinone 5'-phosphate reductase [Methanobacterium sp. CWC-01]WJI09011.1 2,5-diamino-6-(ribosylamino)-4(3H)-pyrimidinone 5'-phosphate reductase [Methanobacterium sp. CWC-01]